MPFTRSIQIRSTLTFICKNSIQHLANFQVSDRNARYIHTKHPGLTLKGCKEKKSVERNASYYSCLNLRPTIKNVYSGSRKNGTCVLLEAGGIRSTHLPQEASKSLAGPASRSHPTRPLPQGLATNPLEGGRRWAMRISATVHVMAHVLPVIWGMAAS